MADTELVIKIPEEIIEHIKDGSFGARLKDKKILIDAVMNGTPLPKGHGNLVDLDKMCADYWDGNYMEIHKDDLKNIKTIIEADKAESEVNNG